MLFPVLSLTLERKYMFLLCNGIVAFLAKSFSFTSYSPSGPYSFTSYSPSGPYTTDTFLKSNEHGMTPIRETEAPLDHEGAAIGRESRAKIKEIDDDNDDARIVKSRYLVPLLSEEAGGNEANMSTDELNRKFDEFIRKTKGRNQDWSSITTN